MFASAASILWNPVLAVLVGTSLVIASACVANNYLDRKMDSRMDRTKTRASVTGSIPLIVGLIFMALLLAAGFFILAAYTNIWVVSIGIVAYIFYVFIYGWAKRNTVHSTLVGAIPGALPAMAGYVAVDGSISLASVLIFLVIFAWQMPHFYAISIFRKKEYASAEVPVLGVVKPFNVVRSHILAYMCVYLLTIVLLISFQVIGPPSGLLLLAGAAYWFSVFRRTRAADETKWAKSIFGASLVLSLTFLVASILNVFVPPAV
jgi:protoheme IX farnesyltransferase